MIVAFSLIILGSLLYIVWNLFGVVFARGRRKGKFLRASIGFVVTVISAIGMTQLMSQEAQEAGFENYNEMTEAQKAGITDPAIWAKESKKRQLATAEAKKRSEEKSQKEAQKKAEKEAEDAKAALAKKQEEEAKAALAKKAKADACRNELKCWAEKKLVSATVDCQGIIERSAKFDYKWVDGFLEPKFSHYRWSNKAAGIVTYIGDRIKMQNGFGAWVPIIYQCDYNPDTETVLDVRINPGRL